MAGALADAGADVSIVARGPHLAAIKKNGMTLRMNGEEKNYKLNASDDPADLGRTGLCDRHLESALGAGNCRYLQTVARQRYGPSCRR